MNDIELAEEAKEENPSEPIPDVATAAEPGQPPESDDPSPTTQVLLKFDSGSSTTSLLSIEKNEKKNEMVHSSESLPGDEFNDAKFTQTFFKFMKNLSDQRCVEILNMEVDHEDKTIVFYQRSLEFIREKS